jgi:hypothetical protein
MDIQQNSAPPKFQVNGAPMVVGAVLIGVGGVIGMSGLIVGSTALMSAARRWFRELEMPPGEAVKHKLGQTRAATVAGATAWHQHHNGVQPAHA